MDVIESANIYEISWWSAYPLDIPAELGQGGTLSFSEGVNSLRARSSVLFENHWRVGGILRKGSSALEHL